MSQWELLLVSIGLSLDAFAISLGVGAHGKVQGARPAFRLWFHFGLFQTLMTILGWSLGAGLEKFIVAWDHWVAAILLGIVGGRMVQEGLRCQEPNVIETQQDPSRGANLMFLSVATSLDALAVGVSLGVLRLTIWYPGFMIGLVTAVMSLIGLRLGRFAGDAWGKRMEVLGGLVLLGLALKIWWLG